MPHPQVGPYMAAQIPVTWRFLLCRDLLTHLPEARLVVEDLSDVLCVCMDADNPELENKRQATIAAPMAIWSLTATPNTHGQDNGAFAMSY